MLIGDKFARAIYLKDYPSYLLDKFVSDITNFSFNIITTMNIRAMEQDKALKLVKNQITGMETNKIDYQKRSLKNGYLEAFIPHELKQSLEDAAELLDDISNKNQKMFLVNFVIVHIADTKEDLDNDTKLINSMAKKHLCQMGTLNYQQEDALASILPIGNNRLKINR